MKKVLSLVLAFTLVIGLASFSASAEGEKIKLVGMCWGSTAQYEAQVAELFEAYPELAEKYEVEFVLGGSGSDSVAEKIRLAMSSNENICDFCVLNYMQLPEFTRAEVLTDLSGAIEQYLPTMTSSATTLAMYDGKYVAVPFEVKTKVWFYRADIFEECGVHVEDIKNVDDFIAAGLKIKETYPDSYMWNLGATPSNYQFYLTLSGNGAKFFDDDGNYVIASDEPTRKMLEDYKKMYDAGIIAPVSDWTTDWESMLANGQIVSQLSAGWLGQDIFLPTYSGEGNKWEATTWPVIGGTDSGSDAGGSVMVVPAFSSHAAEAAELISAWCLSEEGTKVVFRANGSLPQNTEALKDEALFETAKQGYFGDTFVNAQIAALDKYAIFNYSPNDASEETIVVEYFMKAITSEMTIDEALQAAQADMEIVIGNALD